RRVSRLSGHLARAAAFAHAVDVRDERHLGHLAGRFDCDCRRHGSTSQQSGNGAWLYRGRLFDYKRGGWIRDYRSHVADVQTEEVIVVRCPWSVVSCKKLN